MDKEYLWVKVADYEAEIRFNQQQIAEATADGKNICIARFKGEMFAFAAKCPHASGLFLNGHIDALGNVVCPLHRYKFCIKNGRNISGEGYYLKHWPVSVREEGVFVGFEKKSFLGF